MSSSTIKEFFGQTNIKKNLYISLKASKNLKKSLPHMLFYSPPGYGKTTLAKIIANEIGSRFISISAPTLRRPADIVSILASLKKNDILFIDEIQSLQKNLEEILYTSMDEFILRFVYENDENSKPVEIELEPFTLIAATTALSRLSHAFRSRFPILFCFENYTIDELSEIAISFAKENNFILLDSASTILAQNSRGTPRVIKNLCLRTIDFCSFNNKKTIDECDVIRTLSNLQIYENGLTNIDVKILKALKYRYNKEPVSLEAISSCIDEPIEDLMLVYEPFLVRNNYINRTRRGRQITLVGLSYLEEIEKKDENNK